MTERTDISSFPKPGFWQKKKTFFTLEKKEIFLPFFIDFLFAGPSLIKDLCRLGPG
jgi:hypothetical protein